MGGAVRKLWKVTGLPRAAPFSGSGVVQNSEQIAARAVFSCAVASFFALFCTSCMRVPKIVLQKPKRQRNVAHHDEHNPSSSETGAPWRDREEQKENRKRSRERQKRRTPEREAQTVRRRTQPDIAFAVTVVRQARGMSKHELARVIEMPRQWLQQVENGKRDPNIPSVHKLAKGLKVSARTLVAISEFKKAA
jgi:ribosome-binding protein aMBF1 (putative translation factor)